MLVARSNDRFLSSINSTELVCLISIIVVIGFASSRVAGQDPNVNFEGLVNGVRANLSEGAVFFERNDSREKLATGLVLEDGDRIISERSSRAEVLLQPGNYVRLASDTQLKFITTTYDKLRLQLTSGSINFELLNDPWSSPLTEAVGRYDLIRLITPVGEILIVQPGVMRISISTDNTVEVIVRSGTAIFDGQLIKSKKVGVKKNGALTISDRDAKLEDDFDSWCRSRAEQLVKANRALKKDPLWIKTHEDGKEPAIDFEDADESSSGGSPYVVSARPGTVIFVDTGVEILRGKNDWQAVDEKTEFQTLDRLRTAPFSRIELSIFPDITLRLDGNSELLLDALTNEGVTLKLVRGAMIVDAAIFNKKNLPPIRIGSESRVATIADDGNYRVDMTPRGEQLTVREGKVSLSGRSIGGCRTIIDVVSDCGKKRNDTFDYWSQSRGEGLSFAGRAMASWLIRRRKTDLRERGFWYLVTGAQQFTFVPFYVKTFQSPYGGEYSVALTSKERRWRMPMPRPLGNPFPARPFP